MRRRSATEPSRLFIFLFLLPALFLYTLFVAWPMVQAFLYSLQDWDGLGEAEWAGLGNFRDLLEDDGLFLSALWHNVVLIVGAGSVIILLALAFAALLHRRVRGAAVYRVAFFFPNIIAAVAVALLWILLYSTTDFGLFNGLLTWLQLHGDSWNLPFPRLDLPYPFLASQHLIYALIPMLVWMATGFYMVLFLAAMEGIPESYYEAATLDGATGLQQFRHITLPMIREVITIGVIFLIITVLKFFDPVWVMENQSPTPESHVIATLLYQKVFSEYNVGYGSAVAVVLFVLVFSATLLSLWLGRRERLEY